MTAPGSAPALTDDLEAEAFPVYGQLVDGGGSEGIGRREEDLLHALDPAEVVGELRDGRRLADAVDAQDENEERDPRLPLDSDGPEVSEQDLLCQGDQLLVRLSPSGRATRISSLIPWW
jgi:hypothetical protein